jgi:hypothetical protein
MDHSLNEDNLVAFGMLMATRSNLLLTIVWGIENRNEKGSEVAHVIVTH